MYAFHNDVSLQAKVLAQVDQHVALDQVRNGSDYWDGSSGCFIGCLAHSDSTYTVESLTGWPLMLQRIAENIFEALPQGQAPDFFKSALHAPRLGADLSLVSWKFLQWCINDVLENYGTDAVKAGCAPAIEVVRKMANGEIVSPDAARAAADAAYAAYAARAADAADAARANQAKKLIELLCAA